MKLLLQVQKNELYEMKKLVTNQEHEEQLEAFIAEESITWHFIPTTKFWKIMEAAVKSIKYHLHRVAIKSSLTYEEFTT